MGSESKLQTEGRFADTGFATQQYERSAYQTATQNAIYLAVTQVDALVYLLLDLGNGLRTRLWQMCRYGTRRG